jgi:hypothetical protein
MSLTSYRAAPPRVTMCWVARGIPEALFVVHSDFVGLDGGLLHPASPYRVFCRDAKRAARALFWGHWPSDM